MSAVLCLPACLCVSAAASRGQAPHGNPSMASVRRLASRPLHEALGTGLASQVYAIGHGLEIKKVPLVIHLVKEESHRAGLGNHEADGAAQAVDKEQKPDWKVPERKKHLAYTSKSGRRREGQVGGGGGQGQAGTKSVSAAGAQVAQVRGGGGGGRAEGLHGGQAGTAHPLPQCAEAGNDAQKAANQMAAGNHGAGASAGNDHEVVQTYGDGPLEEYMRCHCGRGQETSEHFMRCEQYKGIEGPLVRDQDVLLLKKGARGRSAMGRELGKEGHRKGLRHMVIPKLL